MINKFIDFIKRYAIFYIIIMLDECYIDHIETLIQRRTRTINDRKREIDYAKYEEGLIKINNYGNKYCLFYAVEIARLDKMEKNRSKFKEIRRSERKQWKYVERLLNAINIPRGEDGYDAGEYLPKIKKYYDAKWPGHFKIYVFGRYGKYKPLIKTGDVNNSVELCLYYDDDQQHFDVIPTITTFFAGINYYCFACERPFRDKNDHRMKCQQLCINCRGISIFMICQRSNSI